MIKAALLLAGCLCAWTPARAELRVPAFTAYLEPDPAGAKISATAGVTGWTNPALKVLWFGSITVTGQLDCAVELRLPAGTESKLRLTVASQSHETVVTGAGDAVIKAGFGQFDIAAAGYQEFTLESLNGKGRPAGGLQTLVLDGPAAEGAHFNLKPRRNAASVHLAYPTPGFTNIDAFYCEVTAIEAPVWTYFEACGWQRGYMGMQVNSPTERRIIFSVWDSGGEVVNRTRVAAENRVMLAAKGKDVFSGDFGNEGTGGHSHLITDWKTGSRQRFLVTARPVEAGHTVYSGCWFDPGQNAWRLISSWNAPKDGGYMRGLYSFNEDFAGGNGQLRRKAWFGNQWFHTADGRWHEQTTATFSHDETGKADRLDRFMGVENQQFFLSNGGFIAGYTRYGERFSRPATGHHPVDLDALLTGN